ncbi:hypothetical protein I4U23_021075 [Adineta vaga]|nr:hypothetical protein I4U23_021075 [Adineta vaga]
MPETTCEKLKRHFSPFTYAFTPSHIKSVLIGTVTEYETPKIVTIHSYSIALTCRFVQLLILFYAFGYLMWYKRGYQERDPSLISSVTLKVKGVASLTRNQTITLDNADFVIPPQENNAIFIMTNFIRTDQQPKRCGEGLDIKDAKCTNDSQCKAFGAYPAKSNGRWTGKCSSEGRCEIEGWCPVENDLTMPTPIMDSLNFTIFVKNFVEFTRFNVSRTNIFHDDNNKTECRYHPINDKYCPIFRIEDLLNLVEPDEDERAKMLQFGAVIRIKIDWICNLDLGQDQCKPRYSFGRLDSRYKEEKFSFGFNFRYASHWKWRTHSHRTLTKAFGLRFIVTVNGEAGQFNFLVLTLNIGSMIGVLGLATFICDIVALYFCKQGSVYRRQKFQTISLASPSTITATTAVFTKPLLINDEIHPVNPVRIKRMNSHLAEGDEC